MLKEFLEKGKSLLKEYITFAVCLGGFNLSLLFLSVTVFFPLAGDEFE